MFGKGGGKPITEGHGEHLRGRPVVCDRDVANKVSVAVQELWTRMA